MRPNLAFVSALALAGAVSAQGINTNNLPSYDATTEFTSRARVGGTPGFVSQGFHHGIAGGVKSITKAVQALQDQNPSTQEPWTFGYCYTDAAGAPEYGKNNVILANYRLPFLARTTPAAWLLTLNLNSPTTKVTLNPPKPDMWNYTWNFQQAANWTSDGISVHMSQAATFNGTLLCFQGNRHREIPRSDRSWDGTKWSHTGVFQILEHQAWTTVGSGPAVSSMERMWRLLLSTDEMVLKAQSDNSAYNSPCPNPNNGGASQDPDVKDIGAGSPARNDDLSWQINGGSSFAGGIAVLFHSQTVMNPGIPIPGISGNLFVDFTDPLFALIHAVTLDGVGNGTIKQGLGATTPPSLQRTVVAGLPSWSSQAYLIGTGPTGKRAFSNVATIRTILTPKTISGQFIMSSTVKGTQAKITKKPTDRTIFIRNDGPRWDKSTSTTLGGWGVITVTQWASTQQLPGTIIVPARTAMRMQLAPPANRVEVAGDKTQPTSFSYQFNY